MTVYSNDEVDYGYNEIHDLICDWYGMGEIEIGEVVEIYEAETEQVKASELNVRMLEDMSEYAYEELEGSAENWPNLSKKITKELEAEVGKIIDKWADKHNVQPKYLRILKPKKLKVVILDDVGGYKILGGA